MGIESSVFGQVGNAARNAINYNYNLSDRYNNGLNIGVTPFGRVDLGGQYSTNNSNLFPKINSTNGTGGGFLGALGGFGNFLGGIASIGGNIMSGISALQQARVAREQLDLARQQFGFQKGLANRNLANQAKQINNAYDASAAVAGAMSGGWGGIDQATYDSYQEAAKEKHVDGSEIA